MYANKRKAFIASVNELREKVQKDGWNEDFGDEAGAIYCIKNADLVPRYTKSRDFRGWLLDAQAKPAKTLWRLSPHSLGITLAMVMPIYYDVSFFIGGLLLCIILPKVLKTDDDTLNTLAAAGIIGEGVGSLGVAILKVMKFL
jgi:hypothetical protein